MASSQTEALGATTKNVKTDIDEIEFAFVLVKLYQPLLQLIPSLRVTKHFANVPELRDQINQLINSINNNPVCQQFNPHELAVARYGVYCVVDEAILSNADASGKAWYQNSLVSEHFGETIGGERFYEYVDELISQSAENNPLVYLYHYLLNLGYKGKYYQDPQALSLVIKQLQLHHQQSLLEHTLKLPMAPLAPYTVTNKVKSGVLGAILVSCLIVTCAVGILVNRQINTETNTVTHKLQQLVTNLKPQQIRHLLLNDNNNLNGDG